jgi:hypothetical protein
MIAAQQTKSSEAQPLQRQESSHGHTPIPGRACGMALLSCAAVALTATALFDSTEGDVIARIAPAAVAIAALIPLSIAIWVGAIRGGATRAALTFVAGILVCIGAALTDHVAIAQVALSCFAPASLALAASWIPGASLRRERGSDALSYRVPAGADQPAP